MSDDIRTRIRNQLAWLPQHALERLTAKLLAEALQELDRLAELAERALPTITLTRPPNSKANGETSSFPVALLPCPFCGTEASEPWFVDENRSGTLVSGWSIACEANHCSAEILEKRRDDAIRLWNTRA